MRKSTRLLYATIGLMVSASAWAIFTNGGFETNSYAGWTKTFGLNPGLTGSAPFTAANIVINPGGSDVSTIVGNITDPRAPALNLPRAGSFTAKVNNEANGAIINLITQTDTIKQSDRDATDGKLHVRFSFAAVLEDPGHSPNQQPYFHVRLRNTSKSTVLFDNITYSGQPGRTFVTTNFGGSVWKSTPFINVDVIVPDANLGDSLEIRAVGADCSLGGHGGYVYLDGFGSAIVPPGPGPGPVGPLNIPTLSQWAMLTLTGLLGLMGVWGIRRREQKLK